MQTRIVSRQTAVQIIRDELAREGVAPLARHVDAALQTVHTGGLLLHTGAKLLFSRTARRYVLGGYAWDDSDLAPFTDPEAVALRSQQANRLFN